MFIIVIVRIIVLIVKLFVISVKIVINNFMFKIMLIILNVRFFVFDFWSGFGVFLLVFFK